MMEKLNSEETDQFSVTVEDLPSGDYKLKARVTDECQNEKLL